jgi:predicted heme/steroid binding protein
MTSLSLGRLALYGLTLAFPLAVLFHLLTVDPKPAAKPTQKDEKKSSGTSTSTTIMQPERTDLEPPKDDPFTQEQLKAYDGTDSGKPVYVAIKGTYHSPLPPLSPFAPRLVLRHLRMYMYDTGTVFDVTRKRETYGPGGSYAILAGKDGSRALGLSSLKPEDAVPDWSTLEEKDRKTLNDWHTFFTCVVFSQVSLFRC